MTKEEKKDEMKNRISMALKDPILQQGFEIICKENEQIEHLREERNYFQEKCEDIELNYYCDHKGGCKVQELEKEFQDGAEYGYNKANEWHYVKDGDLPKAYQECYFIYSNTYGEDNKVIFSEGNINVLTGLYAFYLDEETGEETTDPCFYDDINDDEISPSEVYAWKEIVLPVLPKEKE